MLVPVPTPRDPSARRRPHRPPESACGRERSVDRADDERKRRGRDGRQRHELTSLANAHLKKIKTPVATQEREDDEHGEWEDKGARQENGEHDPVVRT